MSFLSQSDNLKRDGRISMDVIIDECVVFNNYNEVTFVIYNYEKEDIIISSELLYIHRIFKKDEFIVPFKKLKRVRPQGIEKYITVPACSEKEITFLTEDFTAYILEKGEAYTIVGRYDGGHLDKGKKCDKNLYRETLDTDPFSINVCQN